MNLTTSDLADRLVLLCDEHGRILQRAGGERSAWAAQLDDTNLFDVITEESREATRTRWAESVRAGVAFQIPARIPSPITRIQTLLLTAALWERQEDQSLWIVVVEVISNTILDSPHEIALGRAVLETAVDAIITIDTRGRIHSVNPAACRMFDFSPEELLGQNISILMPEPYCSQHDSYLSRYQNTGEKSIIGVGRRVTGKRSNGEEFPIHLAVSEFVVGAKKFYTGMIRDLSELDHVQRQLLQSERLAAIGQMVTGLAHESRNALQRAQACLDILALDLADAPEQLDLARRTTAALKQLHRLYEEVRGYAAPIHLEFRACRLSSIWRKEWDHLHASRDGKDISFVEQFHPDDHSEQLSDDAAAVDYCEVDVHRMEQVFRNVLENAIHACNQKGCVNISCQPSQLDGEAAVEVCVSDTGTGLSDEVARQVFEPFFTTKQKGTGLGMAIVQRIMNAHGASIHAIPGESGGTEIRFVLPRTSENRNKFR